MAKLLKTGVTVGALVGLLFIPAEGTDLSQVFKDVVNIRAATPFGDLITPFVDEEAVVTRVDTIIKEEEMLGDILSPIDWMKLGMNEFEKKIDLIEMPDLGLGCETFGQKTVRSYYDFYEFSECQWVPVNSFPKYEKIKDWSNNTSYPVISNLFFPFFGKLIKPPHVLLVSSNGYITIGDTPNAGSPVPAIEQQAPPFNVITGLWTKLIATPGSKVLYGNFRIGYKVLCTRFEWRQFQAPNAPNTALFQLDICSNGIFTSRIKRAKDLNKSQIGLSKGGEAYYKYAALPIVEANADRESNTATVMKPAKFDRFGIKNAFLAESTSESGSGSGSASASASASASGSGSS